MNVLIINLTRFGDLLQMQPLILGLKSQGHTVGLVCLENFAAATVLLRGLDFVAPLPGGKFLRHMDTSWHLALGEAEELFAHIKKDFPVHQIINTTATISARLLSRRIAQNAQDCPEVSILGFGLDEHGFGISGDMWSTFLQGASAERLNCPFNIVDMFRAVAGLSSLNAQHTSSPLRGLEKPNAQLQQSAQHILQSHAPQNCAGYVAFQLGASEKRRQWAVEHFAHVGATLWQKKQLCPVLLGSPAEKDLALSYEQCLGSQHRNHSIAPHPYINLIGKTDIPHLGAVLHQCDLLITNDTGTMHLAAGLDVPVLSLFLATAQAWDTGPYMTQACCLEPDLSCHPCAFQSPCVHMHNEHDAQPCLTCISSHTVIQLALHFLEHNLWPKLVQQEARIWLSLEDEQGFATLQCLSGHEKEDRSHWLMIQRHFYRHILDDKHDYGPAPMEHINALTPAFREHIKGHLHSCTQLLLLVEEQILILKRMPSKNYGERIIQTCTTIQHTLAKCIELKALSYLWLVLFQERGGAIEDFLCLVQSLRGHLCTWHKAMDISGDNTSAT